MSRRVVSLLSVFVKKVFIFFHSSKSNFQTNWGKKIENPRKKTPPEHQPSLQLAASSSGSSVPSFNVTHKVQLKFYVRTEKSHLERE